MVFRGGMARNCHSLCGRVVARLRESKPKLAFRVKQGKFSPIVGVALFALAGDRTLPPKELAEELLGSLPGEEESPFLYASTYFGG